ncbi:lipid storage droplets surface-binding protein 2-like [Anabrus simplex]|uniref:lipid storage droplets surface-binding protein 2-like n=1 Tax=Anabrus simplex TaxID=316456 RepID=UPI0035A36D62
MAGNFESLKKVIQLPLVEAMLKSSSAVYERIKNSNGVVNWTLSVTESTVQKALEMVGVSAPIPGSVAKKLDQVLIDGIAFLEEKMPIVKKTPQQIYQEAKDYVSSGCQKLDNYKEKFFSLAKNSVDQTKERITSFGDTATQPLRDAVKASEKFVDEKLKPEATALATTVATVPEQVLGAVAKLTGDITCSTCQKQTAAASTVPAVTVPSSTSGTQISAAGKAT